MSYQSYKDLEIYQLAHTLAVEIHTMTTKRLPDFERYEEGAQIRKSAKSICSNIVEGFGRRRHKNEFIQFLTYALASCDETREHLYLLWDTGSLKDKELYQHFNQKYDELGKKITKFIQAVEIGHLTHKSSIQYPASSIQHPVSSKGAALIIVIFAMMLFAMLGWTLVNLQSGSFFSNLSTLDSERALHLAEAGIELAMNQLSQNSCWRTSLGLGGVFCGSVDSDCTGDWLPAHTLGNGQYSVCCRNPTPAEQTSATVVIESRGFSPSQATPRAMREAKMLLQLGSFDKVLQAKNIFDWTAMNPASRINGNIQALNYDRDGDPDYNEPGVDYADPNLPLGRGNNDRRFVASEPYPTINMAYLESEAKTPSYNPAGDNIWTPPLTATIANIGSDPESGKIKMDVNTAIFTNSLSQWNSQAIRNISKGSWQNGSWAVIYETKDTDTVLLDGVVSWAIGDRITLIPKISSLFFDASTYTITFNCAVPWTINEALRNFSKDTGQWDYAHWGVIRAIATTSDSTTLTVRMDDSVTSALWATGDWIGEVKRYRKNVPRQTLWYIMADVLFDVRDRQTEWEPGSINGDIVFRKTSLVAEGDIGVRGTNRLFFSERPFIYPNLATQNGNITSLDALSGPGQRDFDDIIYTQNGNINFNFLDTMAIFGNNITLAGRIRVRRYDTDLLRLTGFSWGFSRRQWQEE